MNKDGRIRWYTRLMRWDKQVGTGAGSHTWLAGLTGASKKSKSSSGCRKCEK